MVEQNAYMRYGFITQIDYPNGVAKVYIEELDIVTDWATLPKLIKQNFIIPINSQALVVYDGKENYEIVNIIPYSDDDQSDLPPTWVNDHTEGVEFADGSKVIYDSANKIMTINAPGADIQMNCKSLTVNGDLNTSGKITSKGDIVAGEVSLETHIHTTSQGNTGTPVI